MDEDNAMRPQVDLFQKLYTRQGVLNRLIGKDDERVAVVGQIAACGDPTAAPYLVPLLFESNALSAATSHAIAELLGDVSPEEIVRLDEGSRVWYLPYRWYEVKLSDISRLSIDPAVRPAVLGLLSFHPNGHVRQRAVELLAKVSDGRETPFLLLRLNDWVQPVRDAARRAVLQRLEGRALKPFLANLHLVFRLADCLRDDHSPIINAVVHQLIGPTSQTDLGAALDSPSRFVRRKCYRWTMSVEGSHRQRVVRHALQSGDAVLRLWATRDARSELPDEELSGALTSLLHDTFMPIRREAIITVLNKSPHKARATLWCALLDRSTSIRELARFHLRKASEVDFAHFYREAVRTESQLPQSVVGLGETGTSSDVELLLPLMKSTRRAVRRAATRAVGMLAGDDYVTVLFQAVKDDSKKVSTEAHQALIVRVHLLPMEELLAALRTDSRLHVRLAALSLINEIGAWDGLPYLVETAADVDEHVSSFANRKVLARVNRVFTRPSPEQRVLIAETLDRYSDRLPVAFADECRAWLEGLR